MDDFVDALQITVGDDGQATIDQMVLELRARAAKFPRNPVIQSTAVGLEAAYRLAIVQRVIDLRFGTDRSPNPDNTLRRLPASDHFHLDQDDNGVSCEPEDSPPQAVDGCWSSAGHFLSKS
jgi:hypothetical protein